MANLWERQDYDTDKSWAAFVTYRDLGASRSLDHAWRVHDGGKQGTAPGYFQQWARVNQWVDRAAAYDAHLDAVKLSARAAALEDGIIQDRKTYRETIKREAAQFARDAITLQKRAMAMGDEVGASLVFSRAVAAWEKARNVEGLALGLISGG